VGERGEEREREGVEAARRALVRVLRWPVGMPITALVLTLDDDPEARRAARRSLEQDARLWVGDEVGGRVPLVLETASLVEGERAVEALSASDGVLFVDVVAIDFSDTEA
jgi:CheY-like chemotaxis protein